MEPEGSFRARHYSRPVHPREGKRLRKRHSVGHDGTIDPPPGRQVRATIRRVIHAPARRDRRNVAPRRGGRAGIGSRLCAGLITAALLVAACGSTASPVPSGSSSSSSAGASPSSSASVGSSAGAPSSQPTPTQDAAAIYAAIEPQVEAIRDLRPTTPVDPKLIDEDALKTYLAQDFKKSNPPEVVAANERALKALGLFPAQASLEDLELQLLGSQVAGFYDADTKQLNVVSRSGGLGPIEKVTFAHEFTHALQDQHFGLNKLVDTNSIGEGDQSLAHLALAEGDAVLVQSAWTQQNLSTAELLQLLAASSDPAQTQLLNSMPAILRETLLFPYTSGLAFVTALQSSGGWAAVDAAYGKPPASTEQLLHPDKYSAHEAPVSISVPKDLAKRLGAGWSVALTDSLGEFQLRIWLREVAGLSDSQAAAAASGWGGDRLILVEHGSTYGLALLTAWDSATDATEFSAGAGTALGRLPDAHALIEPTADGRVSVFVASDQATIDTLAGALGLAG